ncbi:WD40 repeat domain-containing protein [Dapis sp. BLCC M126]|uniref:WD40 repeat domain-containing protein n=1 Tax=Dapis sp. BLCC M126 TaxID=3400189 RepID=UPI003CF9659B
MSEAAQISAELEKERELRKQTEKMLNEALRKELNSARRAAITLGGMVLTIGGIAIATALFGINSYLSGLSAASKDNTELDRLVSAIDAGKKLKWLSLGATPGTKLQVLSELSTAIQEVKEFNRFEEHEDDVTHVSFSNDEKMIATGSKDDTVKVWSVDGSQEEKFSYKHTDDITQVDFSSDGKIVASASKDNRAIIRWIDGSREEIILEHSDDVLDVSFSQNNQFLATGCKDGKVRMWRIKDGSVVKIFDRHTAPVTHVTFSPNGKIVASADDYDNVKLWFIDEEKEDVNINNYATTDIEFIDNKTVMLSSRGNDFKVYKVDGELIKRYGESLEDYTHNVISDNRKLIFSVLKYSQNYLRVNYIHRSNRVWILDQVDKHSENISHLSFSPNNKFLVSASEDDTVIFWKVDNLSTGNFFIDRKEYISSFDKFLSATITRINNNFRKVEVLQNNQDFLTKIIVPNSYTFSFSPDNQNFITNSTNYSYSPKLWNIDRGEIPLQENTESVKNISVSSDGKIIAAIYNHKFIQLWDSEGVYLKRLEHNEVDKIAFSPDSEIVVSASYNQIKFWSNEGELIAESDGNYQQLEDIVFSPNSEAVAVVSDDQVNFFSRSGQLINSFNSDNKKIEKIILSPDKQIIATRSHNQVKLWNLDGKLIQDLGGHYQKVEKVIFSPDSQIIATIGDDNFAKLWRIDGTYIGKLEHIDQVRSLDFSRDSKKIITLSYNYERLENSVIKLWKSDGIPIKPYQIYDYGINNINLHPDGNFIVSTSSNVVKLWDSDGKLITILKGHYGEINDVKFSPDGEHILSGSDDEKLKLWSLEGKLISTFEGHTDIVSKVTFSPDGKMIASVSNNDTVILWDFEKKKLKKRIKNENELVESISFSPNSDILAIEHDYGKVTLHLLNGIFTQETQLYTTNSFLGEKFSPDGKAIAVQNQSGVLLLNADLDDLLNRACNWASAYLKTTKDKNIKHLCD